MEVEKGEKMFITVGFKIRFDEKEKIEFYSTGEQNRGEKKLK